MSNATDRFMFTVPLTSEAFELANKFKNQHENPDKANQVYRNTLAIYAVAFYCRCMEIETSIEASESFNLSAQTLMDVADLELTNIGKIECRPVLPDAKYLYIPAETWEDRIGYIVVEIDEDSREATLLGFFPPINPLEMAEKIPIEDLQPLESFLDCLEQLEEMGDDLKSESKVEPFGINSGMINLSDWLANMQSGVGDSWQSAESFLNELKERQLIFRFANVPRSRSAENNQTLEKASKVKRFKLLDQELVLAVDCELEAEENRNLVFQLYPAETSETYLPEGLQLIVFDDESDIFLEAKSTAEDNWLQLLFRAKVGERFKIEVAWGDFKHTEEFVV